MLKTCVLGPNQRAEAQAYRSRHTRGVRPGRKPKDTLYDGDYKALAEFMPGLTSAALQSLSCITPARWKQKTRRFGLWLAGPCRLRRHHVVVARSSRVPRSMCAVETLRKPSTP